MPTPSDPSDFQAVKLSTGDPDGPIDLSFDAAAARLARMGITASPNALDGFRAPPEATRGEIEQVLAEWLLDVAQWGKDAPTLARELLAHISARGLTVRRR
jgi:hypothetical protein